MSWCIAGMRLDMRRDALPAEKGELPLTSPPAYDASQSRRSHVSAFGASTVLKLVASTCLAFLLLSRPSIPNFLNHLRTQSGFHDVNYPPTSPLSPEYDDPASEFKDDIFPLRQHDPWDISTDFPYPRTLTYDAEEGTWLRLDVHPTSGDLVFDMAGDIYCLPASSYSEESLTLAITTQALPVLTGVPHDADPRFSPDGRKLAFRSDSGLGVENIWVIPWASGGCTEMDVRSPSVMTTEARELKDYEEALLAQGVKETEDRKFRRLAREGRLSGQCVLTREAWICVYFAHLSKENYQ